MRYPYVESPVDTWDFASIYYGSARRGPDGKADVGSDKLLYSGVLRDIAQLGGDHADIVDTTLFWVSYEALYEMRVSTTRQPLESLATLWAVEADDDFARRIVDRARELMSGAALIGVLRAVGWSLAWQVTRYRIEVIEQARAEFVRCGAVSGLGSLTADDAHAQLHLAERLKPGNDGLQTALVSRGCLLLAAAHALTLLEPWQPFISNRLDAELQEHRQVIDRILPPDSDEVFALEQVVEEFGTHFAEQTKRFVDHPDQKRSGGDISSYFKTRREAPPALRLEQLSELSRQLVRIERRIERLI